MSSWVRGDRLIMGLPGLGRGPEGPAVFRALASPRKPPPNTIQTPRAGQMQGAQLCQPVPGSPCNWSRAPGLASGIGQRRRGEPSAVGSEALAWLGVAAPRGGSQAKHSFLGGHCPWRTGAGIRQGQGRNAGPGAGRRAASPGPVHSGRTVIGRGECSGALGSQPQEPGPWWVPQGFRIQCPVYLKGWPHTPAALSPLWPCWGPQEHLKFFEPTLLA